MNTKDLEKFLSQFQIPEVKIYELLGQGKIVEKNENIFLLDKDFKENEIYKDYLIFIKLKDKLLPTTFLLNWIKENTSITIFPKTDKTALDFTYSKNINLDQIANKENLRDGYYIMSYNKAVIGYGLKKGKKIINKMNVGEYLKE